MRFFRFRFFQFQLSPRWQRRLNRFREKALWWMAYPFQLVANLFRETGRLLSNWWSRRNLRFLLQGLPALFLAVGALTFGVVVYFQDRNMLASEYKWEGERALSQAAQLERSRQDSAPKLAEAQTCFQRLASISPDDPEYRFRLAQILLLQKQFDAAEAVMRSLAPTDRIGFGPAHLWLAEYMLAAPQINSEMVNQIVQHLIRATVWKKHPHVSINAHIFLAQIYRNRNQADLAYQHLLKVSNVSAKACLNLARWYNSEPGQHENAQKYAEAAKAVLLKRLDNDPDDHDARLDLIECLWIRNEFVTAKDEAQQGMHLASDPDVKARYPNLEARYARAWLLVLVSEYDRNEHQYTPAQRYALLEHALLQFPNNEELLRRLVRFSRQEDELGEKAKQYFQQLRTSGQSQTSVIAQLILGSEAYSQDNFEEARYHWRQALQQLPLDGRNTHALIIANNLAWVLSQHPPIELDHALGLIDTVIEKRPNEPRYHSTRGHILVKMGRYEEARPELEQGLLVSEFANSPALFRVLAETCEKLGHMKAATDYKLRADELEAKAGQSSAGGMPQASPAGGS